MRFPGRTPPEITSALTGSEHLIWSGQPVRGLRLRASDLFLIPFSLLWAGFAFFWEWSALRSDGPTFFALWGIPFVLAGIHFAVGRFFHDAWRRARTFYAVTNERVLIVSTSFPRSVTSLAISTLPAVTLTEGRSGIGTLPSGPVHRGGRVSAWPKAPGADRYLPPRFALVPDARSVYETDRAAQHTATCFGRS